MPEIVEVNVDVTTAAGFDEEVYTHAIVTLPEPETLDPSPIICFGFPGAGYSAGYFNFDMPGSLEGGQAGWHASRGWVFVGCDHLCAGASSSPSRPESMTFQQLVAANQATVEHVTTLLRQGISKDFPALADAVRLGVGQSMGGAFLIAQQGQYGSFDGIAVLGYSARHLEFPRAPGIRPTPKPYLPRWAPTFPVISVPMTDIDPSLGVRPDGLPEFTNDFHFDDEPTDIVAADMRGYPTRNGNVPHWGSGTIPPCGIAVMAPGAVAHEAALVNVPVFIGMGERDLCSQPLTEPLAYECASDVTVFVCQGMAHMHNFAKTRKKLWARVESWGSGIGAAAAGVARQ